ncbi:MAG: hypothetical protein IJL85_02035, partial [Erysipelotrichaceae bacterium]|nr:hypothetical protein [Erysipelotrichaceae bacterium]
DADDYNNQYQIRKLNLDREQRVYLKDLEDKNNELLSRIDALQQKSNQNEEIYNDNLAELNDQKTEIEKDYENRLAIVQNDFDRSCQQLNEKYDNDLLNARNEHEKKLMAMEDKYHQDTQALEDVFKQKQDEYENEKIKVDEDIDKMYQETQEKTAYLAQQQNTLRDSINKIQVDLDAKKVEFKEKVVELEKEKEEVLARMAKQHELNIAKIVEDYETKPTKQLQDIRDEYALKQVEYNENIAAIASRKHKIDDEEADVIRKNKLQREVAENKLNATNSEFLRYKKEIEKTENDLNNDFVMRQKELETYKEELNEQLVKIREQKQLQLDQLVEKNNKEYETKKLEYQSKQNAIEKQYADQLKSYEDNLHVKQANIDSLMSEIEVRRETAEKQNTEIYNEAVAKTTGIQKQLDEILDHNEMERSELSVELEQKKQEISSDLQEVQNSYNSILEEKKRSYDEFVVSAQKKCESLKAKISELEKEKALELSKIDTYENEKRLAIQDREKETMDYVESISHQIATIASQTRQLDTTHKNRITAMKQQIAQTMSEYDNLLRITPDRKKEVEDEYEHKLLDITRSFKQSIDELDSTHNEILIRLENERDQIIENITKEIEGLELARNNKLKEFEAEVKSISMTYDAMLKDEQAKQDALSNQIIKANAEQEQFMNEMYDKDENAVTDYEKQKERLLQIHQDSLKSTMNEFSELTANLKREFDSLLARKAELALELDQLVEKNKKIDESIAEEELRLRYECNLMLSDAHKLLEQKRSKRKQELSHLDILNDSKASLFKKKNN